MRGNRETIRYRLYVGTDEPEAIASRVMARFRAATLVPTIGIWAGQLERSTVVEIIADEQATESVSCLAEVLRRDFGQDVVLVTREGILGSDTYGSDA